MPSLGHKALECKNIRYLGLHTSPALLKGNSRLSTSWAQMKEHAITDLHVPTGS